MGKYVRGYRPRKPEEGVDKVIPLRDDVDVQFTKVPEWTIQAREIAESECQILRRMRVHVGSHYCNFSVEELPNSEFAIVCLSHP